MYIKGMALASALLLTGCCEDTVTLVPKTVVRYERIPVELISDDVVITKPVDKNVFIKASPTEREMLLGTMIVDLYNNIGEYKIRMKAIKDFDDKLYRKHEGASSD